MLEKKDESEYFNRNEIKDLVEKDELFKIKIKKEQIMLYFRIMFLSLTLLLIVIYLYVFITKTGLINIENEDYSNKNKIAIINIDKVITQSYIDNIISKIEKVKKEKSYKEILFVLSSPGGSPTASDNLNSYIKLNKTKIPMKAYLNEICTSGCYYVASAFDKIISNQNTIVGSIGVIIQHYDFEELTKKIGVKEDSLTAGKYKQPLSMFKEMNSENKLYIEENLLIPSYNNFKDIIKKDRKIEVNKEIEEQIFEGRIFIANQELPLKYFIDGIKSLPEYKEEILSNYKNELNFVEIKDEENKSIFKSLLKNEIKEIIIDTVSNLKDFSIK